jgi:hypothetical protein
VTSFVEFDAYVRAREREYVDELKVLIRQPTVSAQGIGIPETAQIVLDRTNHAPNENIAIVDYVDHIRAFGRFLHTFAGRALA